MKLSASIFSVGKQYSWQIDVTPTVSIETQWIYATTRSAILAIKRTAKKLNIEIEIIVKGD